MIENKLEQTLNKDTVIVICGPTASGKSSLAVSLAIYLHNMNILPEGAEIVSADSMQIYRKLDIGTAKITAADSSGIRHHMIDICEPHEYYSVAQYKREATAVIRDIQARNKIAIFCGGTGQYLSALIDGIEFVETPVDLNLRDKLSKRADEEGLASMLMELQTQDPETAARLSISDRKRIIRAHEIIVSTGKTPTEINRESRQKGPDFKFKAYCLSPDRELLYERINMRTSSMLKQGWIEETKQVIESGIPTTSTSMQAIGYRQIIAYLNGDNSLDEATSEIQQATRRYAKRQLTWFRKMPQLKWLETADQDSALKLILADLALNL